MFQPPERLGVCWRRHSQWAPRGLSTQSPPGPGRAPGGLQRQENSHGWSDAETSPGSTRERQQRVGRPGDQSSGQSLRGQWGQEPRAPGARPGRRGVRGAERAGPVRSTGQKQPAPGGLGEQMPGATFQRPPHSVIKTSKVVIQCLKKKNDAKIHDDQHQNLKGARISVAGGPRGSQCGHRESLADMLLRGQSTPASTRASPDSDRRGHRERDRTTWSRQRDGSTRSQ